MFSGQTLEVCEWVLMGPAVLVAVQGMNFVEQE